MNAFARFEKLATKCLQLLPSETAHDVGIWALRRRMLRGIFDQAAVDDKLAVNIPGIGPLPHPICLAAGFDKNAEAIEGLFDLGFSMIELGTITPVAQAGNPKPRMFRYPKQLALINRMGFNNHGLDAVLARIKASKTPHPVGANVGKNKSTLAESALQDFVTGAMACDKHVRYIVINLSSPNTPGLRDLATTETIGLLDQELSQIGGKIWIKIDPDMPKPSFQKLTEAIARSSFQGLVLTNTHKTQYPQAGGVSGHPLSVASTERLTHAYEVHQGELPMIASGGILTGADVLQRICRGALATQIYSALVFRGPSVVNELIRELKAEMATRGFENLQQAYASDYR